MGSSGHWSCGQRSFIIWVLVLLTIHTRDTVAIDDPSICSEFEFKDIDTLREKVQNESPRFSKEARITGGEPESKPRPYMVAICKEYAEGRSYPCGQADGNICAGIIIDKFYILTAASCIENFKEDKVKVIADVKGIGELLKNSKEMRNVEKINVHEGFKRRGDRIENDLAVLKLDKKFEFGEFIQRAHYYGGHITLRGDPIENRTGIIYGWGCTHFTKYECKSFVAEKLYKANVPIWTDEKCQEMLLKLKSKIHIVPEHICAGGENDTGFCYGDPGSPLIVMIDSSDIHEDDEDDYKRQSREEGEEVVIGIASFMAAASCGCDGIPTVYTEIGPLSEWISNFLRLDQVNDSNTLRPHQLAIILVSGYFSAYHYLLHFGLSGSGKRNYY